MSEPSKSPRIDEARENNAYYQASIEMVPYDLAKQIEEELTLHKIQIASTFDVYLRVKACADDIVTMVKQALAGGLTHQRSRLELVVQRNDTVLQQIKFNEPPGIRTNIRLFDLVRYMRSELHEANLITDAEHAWLSAGKLPAVYDGTAQSRDRLEDYDELRTKLDTLQRACEGECAKFQFPDEDRPIIHAALQKIKDGGS